MHDNPGERTRQPEYTISTALVARGEAAGGRCCGAVWEGVEELRELSAKLHGSTVVALDQERERLAGLNAKAEAAQALRAA